MKIKCPSCKAEMELLNHLDCVCPNGHRFVWGKTMKEVIHIPDYLMLPVGPQPDDYCEQCVHNELDPHGFGPAHEPSSNCKSGKRPHCTCDACF